MAVTGGRLAAFEFGSGGDDAPVVLAVHGITGNSHSWIPVARALGHRARLLAVDLRGRGESRELPPPYGLAAHADDLLAVLDDQGLERAVVAGHSLGAYIVAWLAAAQPRRVAAAVLVDGGLRIPGVPVGDPRAAVTAFLGPAIERLKMRFPTPAAYLEWWQTHPAFAGSDVAEEDLAAYVAHDLIGEPPELHSSVSADAVYGDGEDLLAQPERAAELSVPATLLCAPLGLLGEPNPMQPFELALAWAAGAPGRRATLVPDVNHYSITLGKSGAQTVADVLAGALG